jgi:hypothetical protein
MKLGTNRPKTPDLPFVIGQLGVGGTSNVDPTTLAFKRAQAAAAELPEFQGNVTLVKTELFWDTEAHDVFLKGWTKHPEEWRKVGSDYPYHYLGSAKTFCRIGRAFGEGMIELCRVRKQD